MGTAPLWAQAPGARVPEPPELPQPVLRPAAGPGPAQEGRGGHGQAEKEGPRLRSSPGRRESGSCEYTEDALIPKNSLVVVKRIPAGGVKATSKTAVPAPQSCKIPGAASFRSRTEPVSRTSEANVNMRLFFAEQMNDESSASVSLAQLSKTANLAEANASEEDKVKAMMRQSCRGYDSVNYLKKPLATPPPSYVCFRCGIPGHYRKDCPRNGDKNVESVPRPKRSTGIPRSFMMEVKDPNTKGAMLTNTGKYAVPIINAEAYARGKRERPPFLPEEPSSSSSDGPIPDELLCLICKDIMTDAAILPCCGSSYCDECKCYSHVVNAKHHI
ncbi:E3 ubiquitin-protein ligase RBBP6-like isoform 1-T1 [Amazona ochrocephala]